MIEERREALAEATVAYLMDVRAAYLASPGVNALRHWDALQERVRFAARSSGTVAEWATTIARSLRLPAPSESSSLQLAALVREVGADVGGWLGMVEMEYAYLIAKMRLEADRRREQRESIEQPDKGERTARKQRRGG